MEAGLDDCPLSLPCECGGENAICEIAKSRYCDRKKFEFRQMSPTIVTHNKTMVFSHKKSFHSGGFQLPSPPMGLKRYFRLGRLC